jgi:hypothetical protein
MAATKKAEVAKAPPAKPRKHGRPCTICSRDFVTEIDAALIRGEGFAPLSRRYAVSEDAVARHHAKCLPIAARQKGAEDAAEAEGERGSTLLEDAYSLRQKAVAILAKAEASGSLTIALHAIREAGRLIELQGKLMGQIDTSTTLNVTFAPMLVEMQTIMMLALQPYPEAREAVTMALQQISGQPLLLEHQSRASMVIAGLS